MSKVFVILAEGFEEVETITVVDYLRRAGVEVAMVAAGDNIQVTGVYGVKIIADMMLSDIKDPQDNRGIYVPGGLPGTENLKDNQAVIDLVKEMAEAGKLVASICAGPIILSKAGVIDGKKITAYPGYEKELLGSIYKEKPVVRDGNIITSRGPATAGAMAIEMIKYLQGEEKAKEVGKIVLLDMM